LEHEIKSNWQLIRMLFVSGYQRPQRKRRNTGWRI